MKNLIQKSKLIKIYSNNFINIIMLVENNKLLINSIEILKIIVKNYQC